MILKTKDLRNKSEQELNEELVTLRKELFEARMSFHARKLENSSLMKNLRKSIAKILTIQNEKQQENN